MLWTDWAVLCALFVASVYIQMMIASALGRHVARRAAVTDNKVGQVIEELRRRR